MKKSNKMTNHTFMSINRNFKNCFICITIVTVHKHSHNSYLSLYSLNEIIFSFCNGFKYHSNANSFSSPLSAKFHICIFNCLWKHSTWKHHCHLRFNTSKTNSQLPILTGSFLQFANFYYYVK